MQNILLNCIGCMLAAADSGQYEKVGVAAQKIRNCCEKDAENDLIDSIMKVSKADPEQGAFFNAITLELYGNSAAIRLLSECIPMAVAPSMLDAYVDTVVDRHAERSAKKRLKLISEAAAEGKEEEVRALLEVKVETKHRSYLTAAEVLELPDRPLWLIEEVVPDFSTTIMSSPGDTGKSMLAMHMALCISTGADFAGMKVAKQGPVLYIDGENDAVSAARRLRVLGIDHSCKINIMTREVSKYGFDVDDPKFFRDLHDCIQTINPVVVIIDTIRRITSLDLCSDRDVNHTMSRLMECTAGRSLFILAHWKKPSPMSGNSGDRLFGSVDLRNFARCHITLETDRTDQGTASTMTIEKSNYSANRPKPIRLEWHSKDDKLIFQPVDNGGPNISPQARVVCQVLRDQGPQLLRVDLVTFAAKRGVCERDVARILNELHSVGFITFDKTIVNGKRNTLICLAGAAIC